MKTISNSSKNEPSKKWVDNVAAFFGLNTTLEKDSVINGNSVRVQLTANGVKADPLNLASNSDLTRQVQAITRKKGR